MEKLGVAMDPNGDIVDRDAMLKEAAADPSKAPKCPRCEARLTFHGLHVVSCPNCGTEPFEGRRQEVSMGFRVK